MHAVEKDSGALLFGLALSLGLTRDQHRSRSPGGGLGVNEVIEERLHPRFEASRVDRARIHGHEQLPEV